MPAFEGAVALGYRYLETDVHATIDGVLLAFHDDRLDRVTDRVGRIAELPYAEVARARVDGREPIPTFADLLDAFPDTRINVDPKEDGAVEPLVRLLRSRDEMDRLCFGAFSDRRLARLRALLGPRLCTSLGPAGVARLRGHALGLPGGRFSSRCVQVPVRAGKVTIVDERFVDTAHERGLQVHVWTIDDPGEMARLLDLGVDGIMTDRPAVLREVLEERDLWAG